MSSLPSPCQALEADFPLEIIAVLAKTRHGPDKKAPITKTTAFTFFRLGKKAEHEFDISGTLVKTLYVCIVVISHPSGLSISNVQTFSRRLKLSLAAT
jgi:hypothetical protein